MSGLEAVAAVGAQAAPPIQDDLAGPADLARGPASGVPDFGRMVADGLQAVNGKLVASQHDMQALAMGQVENLHDVMIRLEESRIAFQLMMQVRARLLEAYQDVMKMQV